MSATIFQFVDPTVDWLTCTYFTQAGKDQAKALFGYITQEEAEFDKTPRAWQFKGYSGLTTKYASYGTRVDSDLLILRGAVANDWFAEARSIIERVTRIDLACTVKLPSVDEGLLGRYWDVIQKTWEKGHAPRAYSIIRGLDGGGTLYVGARASAEFGRVYDKGVQSRSAIAGQVYRYEVEIKKPLADKVVMALPSEGPLGSWVADYVHAWFSHRNVTPRWLRGENNIIVERDVKIRSAEITLNWLRKSVKPAIIRLQAAGKIEQVLDALGLDQSDLV